MASMGVPAVEQIQNGGGSGSESNGEPDCKTKENRGKTISDAFHDILHPSTLRRVGIAILGGCFALLGIIISAYYFNNVDKPKVIIYSLAAIAIGMIVVGAPRLVHYFESPKSSSTPPSTSPTSAPATQPASANQAANILVPADESGAHAMEAFWKRLDQPLTYPPNISKEDRALLDIGNERFLENIKATRAILNEPGVLKVLFGSNVGYTKYASLPVVRVAGQNLLAIHRTLAGISIDLKIFADDGKIIVQIEDNKFYINPNNSFRVTNPDPHSLVVFDDMAEKVLDIKFLNPTTIRVSGIFRYRGHEPVRIIEDSAMVERGQVRIGCLYGYDGTQPAMFNIP
jgi:hypothetical protein